MSNYIIKSNRGSAKIEVKRSGHDTLELKIGDKKAEVFTEDLAALVRSELPEDRAKDLFMEIEEKTISKGKAWVAVQAKKDIKQGEMVKFLLDITKYAQGGVRTNYSGFIY